MSKKHDAVGKAEAIVDAQSSFKGYTIEEVRYRRAVVALQKEFAKEQVLHDVASLKKVSLLPSKKVAPKLLAGLNYADYALMGFSAFKYGRKIFNLFRRRK